MKKCTRDILDFRVSLFITLIISISICFYAYYKIDTLYVIYYYLFTLITVALIFLAYFFNSILATLLLSISYILAALYIFTIFRISFLVLFTIFPISAFFNILSCKQIAKIKSEKSFFRKSIILKLRRYAIPISFLFLSYLLFIGFDIPVKHGKVINHNDNEKYIFLVIAIISALSIKFSSLLEFKDNIAKANSELIENKESFKLKLVNTSRKNFELLKEELQSYYKQLEYKEVVDNENSWMIKNRNNSYIYLSQKNNNLELEIYKTSKPNLPYLDKLIKEYILDSSKR